MGVRFTCQGTIADINTERDWFYTSCTQCTRKIRDDTGILECTEHGAQPDPTQRYNFKAFITDNSATAQFTFFTPIGDKIVGVSCADLVKSIENPQPNEIPSELQLIIGKNHIFQFHFNQLSKKGLLTSL